MELVADSLISAESCQSCADLRLMARLLSKLDTIVVANVASRILSGFSVGRLIREGRPVPLIR